jgi:putative Mn2+ efflux pump MntP
MAKVSRQALTDAEARARKLAAQHEFAVRMARAIGLWLALTAFGLAVGVAGYAYFESLPLTDAFVNAAMILSGMGPVLTVFKTESGKWFAGCYAIFSGLVIVIATGFVLAPIFHHVLHKFHVETSKDS